MRLAHWESALHDYLTEQARAAFAWGVNDCCHFAATAAERITGTGYGQLYPCDSARSARELLIKHSGVMGIADQHYPRIDSRLAQRGDVVCCAVDGDSLALGVCIGNSALFKTAGGLNAIPMTKAHAAWRIE